MEDRELITQLPDWPINRSGTPAAAAAAKYIKTPFASEPFALFESKPLPPLAVVRG